MSDQVKLSFITVDIRALWRSIIKSMISFHWRFKFNSNILFNRPILLGLCFIAHLFPLIIFIDVSVIFAIMMINPQCFFISSYYETPCYIHYMCDSCVYIDSYTVELWSQGVACEYRHASLITRLHSQKGAKPVSATRRLALVECRLLFVYVLPVAGQSSTANFTRRVGNIVNYVLLILHVRKKSTQIRPKRI